MDDPRLIHLERDLTTPLLLVNGSSHIIGDRTRLLG